MKRLSVAAIAGFVIGVGVWFLLVAALSWLAPSNRTPRMSDLANPLLVWPGGVEAALGILLIGAKSLFRHLYSPGEPPDAAAK
jgi:hypothetical protein